MVSTETVNKYSVLMSVWYKEKAENLKESINSIWNQTVPTDDFVLICNGKLTEELDAVVEETKRPEMQIIRFEENIGHGGALSEGLKRCKHELVARMDSDDISRPDRCERQLAVFSAKPKISMCSGTVEEFSESPDKVEARRVLPEKHEDILKFCKRRNPFNHPCIMYKKTAVEKAGGYQNFYLLDDYYLWIRMLQSGAIGYNIQEPLLWMRGGADMYKRRSSPEYAKSQKALFKYMKDTGFITTPQYLSSVIIRGASSVAPNWLREFMFKKILRK
jgi:glycosyltransferase involved in cell wall biosynthesis